MACNNKNSDSAKHSDEGIGPNNKAAVDSARETINRWTDSAALKMDSARKAQGLKKE